MSFLFLYKNNHLFYVSFRTWKILRKKKKGKKKGKVEINKIWRKIKNKFKFNKLIFYMIIQTNFICLSILYKK